MNLKMNPKHNLRHLLSNKIMCTSHKLKENTQRAPHQSDHKCKDRSKTLIPHSAQSSKFTPVCHHCGVEGHIRPLCY
ncbi:hypothetical protein ACOSQ3_028904 [Xanthoceras sorbifolium]